MINYVFNSCYFDNATQSKVRYKKAKREARAVAGERRKINKIIQKKEIDEKNNCELRK